MELPESVWTLRDAGRFTQALAALDEKRANRGSERSTEVLRAELLERTGRYAESRTLAERLSRTKLSMSDGSLCELVIACLKLESADANAAIGHLQRSAILSRQIPDLEQTCWAQLRLLSILSDRSGPEAVASLLSELRPNVIKAGHAGILAALHIFVAQMEAKRGLLTNAQRHLHLGRQGLATFENLWLEATAENVETCIAIMRSRFDEGTAHGMRCLDLAQEAGANSMRQSALGNLGNLAYSLGKFEEATEYHHQARTGMAPGSDNWNACGESLARIFLAQGRLEECKELLDEIDRSISTPRDRSRYVYRHTQLTRAHYLAREGEAEAALQQVDIVLQLGDESGDQFLRGVALLTKAELLHASNRVAEALDILNALVSTIPSQPPDFFAHFERVMASILLTEERAEASTAHYRRAERIYESLKHSPGLLDLSRSWNQHADEAIEHARTRKPRHGDHCEVSSAIGDITAILLHASRPELVAREIIDLLDAADCVRSATAVARAADGSLESLAHTGDHPETLTSRDTVRALAIGTSRDRTIEVLVEPKPDTESAATINSVELLLALLHDLERGREEREDRATLWPVDELPLDNDNAITMGHMKEIMSFARKIATTDVGVLITGESGTGKEVIARAIHTHSKRAHKPFVPFNCAAVPREMLESQLFGHRRGAFTGADRDNPGVIRGAQHGTLFLDEVGELGLDLQPKLLRFLESGEISPLGETTPLTVNVRIVAATNTNLEIAVREHRFREDLFYRLNVVRLALKPLRDRRDEIPSLVGHFLRLAVEEFHKQRVRIAEETFERLLLYTWPGNVRQLQNEIRRMVALAEPNSVIGPSAISHDIQRATALPAATAGANGSHLAIPLADKLAPTLARIEREMITLALRDHRGRVDAAARALGISRKGLYLKRQRLGL